MSCGLDNFFLHVPRIFFPGVLSPNTCIVEGGREREGEDFVGSSYGERVKEALLCNVSRGVASG